MSLITTLTDITTRIATECKSIRNLINGNTADLSGLSTTTKANLVSAINELHTAILSLSGGGVEIDDASTTSTEDAWSASKIVSAISQLKTKYLVEPELLSIL